MRNRTRYISIILALAVMISLVCVPVQAFRLASFTDLPREQAVSVPAEGEPTSTVFPESTPLAPVSDGITYQGTNYSFTLTTVEYERSRCHVADIQLKELSALKTGFSGSGNYKGKRDKPVNTAKAHNAILAVTGDYYNARSSGIVLRNGVLYREKPWRDVCVLYTDGVMETYAQGTLDLNAAIERGAWQIWSFGPELIKEGASFGGRYSEIQRKNPRCAIGYFEPGHYVLVTVDGRQKNSKGLTLNELSAFMTQLGCVSAYNLDGGATAMMVYDSRLYSSPSGGGRTSSDIIYLER